MLKSSRKAQWTRFKIYFNEAYLLIYLIIFLSSISCINPQEVISLDENYKLSFSTDSIIFDTVFTSIGNLSKRVKIYNPNKNAVNISSLSLGSLASSSYKINLLGEQGYDFNDVYLLGGDSLMLLVTVTIDPQNQNLPFLVKDSIVISTNNNQQDIKLISYGQDAHFLGDSILSCNTVWTADRPYLLYNSIIVDSLCELSIEKGAQIYFHNQAALFVRGTLKAQGDIENKIIFRNDRRDEPYKYAPGQWKGIYFLEGSKGNIIDHAEIHNAVHGLRIGTPDEDTIPDIYVSNTIIQNMSIGGLAAFNSDVFVYNVLINNCGEYTLGNFAGGNYTYNHCTFANFNHTFIRQTPSVVFADNLVLDNNTLLEKDLSVRLSNCIVWGTFKEELLLSHSGGSLFILNTENNILRSNETSLNINNNILNSVENNFPKFVNPEEYDFRLDTLSPAKDAAKASELNFDILGKLRGNKPDIGAYERIETE